MTHSLGVKVMWDRTYSLRVSVPGSMFGETCGLCGQYDGNEHNDMAMGPGSKECLPEDEHIEEGHQVCMFGNILHNKLTLLQYKIMQC